MDDTRQQGRVVDRALIYAASKNIIIHVSEVVAVVVVAVVAVAVAVYIHTSTQTIDLFSRLYFKEEGHENPGKPGCACRQYYQQGCGPLIQRSYGCSPPIRLWTQDQLRDARSA